MPQDALHVAVTRCYRMLLSTASRHCTLAISVYPYFSISNIVLYRLIRPAHFAQAEEKVETETQRHEFIFGHALGTRKGVGLEFRTGLSRKPGFTWI